MALLLWETKLDGDQPKTPPLAGHQNLWLCISSKFLWNLFLNLFTFPTNECKSKIESSSRCWTSQLKQMDFYIVWRKSVSVQKSLPQRWGVSVSCQGIIIWSLRCSEHVYFPLLICSGVSQGCFYVKRPFIAIVWTAFNENETEELALRACDFNVNIF